MRTLQKSELSVPAEFQVWLADSVIPANIKSYAHVANIKVASVMSTERTLDWCFQELQNFNEQEEWVKNPNVTLTEPDGPANFRSLSVGDILRPVGSTVYYVVQNHGWSTLHSPD